MVAETFLTSAQVALRFKVSTGTVTRWHRLGYLPAAKMPGLRGRLRFNPEDVQAFAERYGLEPEAAAS